MLNFKKKRYQKFCEDCQFITSWIGTRCWRCVTLKQRYGINGTDFRALLIKQNGKCAICQLEPPADGIKYRYGIRFGLSVDHCHETGKVRGLLCIPCNTALGRFSTIKILKAAQKYLKNSNK